MTVSLYLSFIAYACAITFLPGPNNVLLLSTAAKHGLKKCLPLLLGIWTGLIAVMLLAGTFCDILGTFVPKIAPYFRFVGAGYILYLAYQTLIRKPVEVSTDAGETLPRFRDGFILQFLNVKVIMLGLASYPGYFLSAGGGPVLILLFAVTMMACCGMGNILWGVLGSFLYPIYNRYYKGINIVMALLLVYCAIKVLL